MELNIQIKGNLRTMKFRFWWIIFSTVWTKGRVIRDLSILRSWEKNYVENIFCWRKNFFFFLLLANYFPGGGFFDNSQQQDAQEFLQFIVNAVKDEMDLIQGKKPFIENRQINNVENLKKEVKKDFKFFF